MPYAEWVLDLPYGGGTNSVNGAAYDPATQRIFVAQAHGDETRPVVHVFHVASN